MIRLYIKNNTYTQEEMSKGSLYIGVDTDRSTNSFISYLKRSGVKRENYNISRSSTDFGKSNYIRFIDKDYRDLGTVRISNHSVGQRRLGNEWNYTAIAKNIHGYRDDFEKSVLRYLK